MTRQDDITHNFHRGNTESRLAFKTLRREDLERIRDFIVRAITRRGERGLTCDEAEIVTTLSHQTCSARFTELVAEGRIERTNRTRPTRSGRQARIHVV